MVSRGRYSRQEILKEIGSAGQKKLSKATVVIVGVGATGSVAAELLVRAGVNVRLIDRDFVELTNLQRQTLFYEADVGKPKASVAAERLKHINADVIADGVVDDLTAANVAKLIAKPNVVLDCTDNMQTRFLLNDYCAQKKIPWIYTGAVGVRGLLMPIAAGGRPCLRCLIPKEPGELETCDTSGVLNTTSVVLASLQSKEAIRIVLGKAAYGDLIAVDVWNTSVDHTKVPAAEDCEVCVKNDFKFLRTKTDVVALCGREVYHVRLSRALNLVEIEERARKTMKTEAFEGVLHLYPDKRKISLFENGRAIVEAKSAAEARSRLAKFVGV